MKKVNMNRLQAYIDVLPQTPEGTSGNISVVHEVLTKNTVAPIVSIRNAIFMGQQPTSTTLPEGWITRKLKSKENGVWMSDSPQEVWQMDEPLRKCNGRVLVGGLGLGVFTRLAILMGNARSVTTVEISPDVIMLVEEHAYANLDLIGTNYTTVLDDLYDYLKLIQPGEYDSAFLDTWQPTGEMCWQDEVVPLRRLCRNKIPANKVYCWNELEMHGQFAQALPRVASMDVGMFSDYQIAYKTFNDAAKKLNLEPITDGKNFQKNMEIQYKNMENDKVKRLMKKFMTKVGTDQWEKEFGELWDKHTQTYEGNKGK